MADGAPVAGIFTNIAEALGLTQKSSGGDSGDLPPPVELALDIQVPREDNAVWTSFDSLEVILTELLFHGTDGQTASVSTGVQFDLRDEDYVDGDELAWGMRISPGTYEKLSGTFEVANYTVTADHAELPIEGFEDIELHLNDGDPWTPESHEEWRFTLEVVLRKNDAEDTYVLEPAVEWYQE